VRCEFARLRREGCHHAVLDAVDDVDLITLGAVLADFSLVTGASGIALGLPENFRRIGLLKPRQDVDRLPAVHGPAAVISASCSAATLAQIAAMRATHCVFDVDPLALAEGQPVVERALNWAASA
jgi:uncharacterized protein YgbK (DUF1537 family)